MLDKSVQDMAAKMLAALTIQNMVNLCCVNCNFYMSQLCNSTKMQQCALNLLDRTSTLLKDGAYF